MTIETIDYKIQKDTIPKSGQVILAHQNNDSIVVYQAYNEAIANYAVQHQKLGGAHFSYSRMSWIKPNFLWMMFRCGWAQKENQERILALWISKKDFVSILEGAVYSTFQESVYGSIENWKNELTSKDVRLQWDPDHDPFGNKLERRAIQLGLKDNTLKAFGEQMIQKFEDITDFVRAQKVIVDSKDLVSLLVPIETEFLF